MGCRNKDSEAYKRHYALMDLLLIFFWLLITGILFEIVNAQEISLFALFTGVIAASAVTLTAHEFVIKGEKKEKESLADYMSSLKNVIALIIDVILKLVVANAVLVYQSLSLDIQPRLVRVKVSLTSESEVTLISLLITLIPGTIVLDVEEKEDGFYLLVHYSYLKSEDLVENMTENIEKWDGKIRGLFK
ncbi:MAG: Na+/H+ antiporter subunit E [Thermoplasmatota archaeon]